MDVAFTDRTEHREFRLVLFTLVINGCTPMPWSSSGDKAPDQLCRNLCTPNMKQQPAPLMMCTKKRRKSIVRF
jgi:hypothetical protein